MYDFNLSQQIKLSIT